MGYWSDGVGRLFGGGGEMRARKGFYMAVVGYTRVDAGKSAACDAACDEV